MEISEMAAPASGAPPTDLRGLGMVIPAALANDHLVAALARSLAGPTIEAGLGLFTRVVDDAAGEADVYRHWATTGAVAGVAVLDVRPDDPRVALLEELGLPFAAVSGPGGYGGRGSNRSNASNPSNRSNGSNVGHASNGSHGSTDDSGRPDRFPTVVVDVDAAAAALVTFLQGRSPRRALYVTSPTGARSGAIPDDVLAAHFEVLCPTGGTAQAVEAALSALDDRPATLVFHRDVDAVAAVSALIARGVGVPEQVCVVSWIDSTLCQSTSPSITAINRRGSEVGELLAHAALAALRGRPPARVLAPDPFVVVREST